MLVLTQANSGRYLEIHYDESKRHLSRSKKNFGAVIQALVPARIDPKIIVLTILPACQELRLPGKFFCCLVCSVPAG